MSGRKSPPNTSQRQLRSAVKTQPPPSAKTVPITPEMIEEAVQNKSKYPLDPKYSWRNQADMYGVDRNGFTLEIGKVLKVRRPHNIDS